MMGILYTTGTGVTMCKSRAAEWMTKAAEQGDPSSALGLGEMYIHVWYPANLNKGTSILANILPISEFLHIK
jgi:TPR repeat protein